MDVSIRSLDVLVVAVYLLAMAGMGLYFARRNRNTEEYFVGGRSLRGWVVGISMLSTSISSITFLAFPAAAFVLDWRQLVSNLMLPFVAVLAVLLFVPLFRRGRLTSAFEYLGERFGPAARLYGALSFILLQLIRLATVLFLLAIPVTMLTGLPMELVIIAVGLFVAFYTVAGGIEAVIWTDVVQAFVLWFGGIGCALFIAFQVPGGLGGIIDIGIAHNKFGIGSLEWNFGERTFWTVVLLGIFHWLAMYSSDQTFVQRYVASSSQREAQKATILYSVLAVPTWTFFFFLGTCLFAYYTLYPSTTVSGMEADEVFPYFILTEIPAGLAGLVLAGVIAAAMSSLDSSINSIATVAIVDLFKPYLAPGREDRYYLTAARLLSTVAAAVMIGGALVFTHMEKESMNDINWMVSSIFGGCLMGLFLIGFFTRRVDNRAVLIALAVAIPINIYLGMSTAGWLPGWLSLQVHAYWVGAFVNVVFIAFAYIASIALRNPRGDLSGLTIWTMRERTPVS